MRRKSGAVSNGSLGVLDLSLVANDAYDLELTVRAGYRQSSIRSRAKQVRNATGSAM
jgi:hypothetical protein